MGRPRAILAATLTVGLAAAGPAPAAPLDRVLREVRIAADVPGASAAVVRDGRLVWAGASGLAATPEGVHPRTGRPTVRRARRVTPATPFSIASLSKTYTAVLALRLVERGAVRLDAPIADWVPRVPGASRVTIRMLLTHTSGYADVEEDEPLASELDLTTGFDPNRRWRRASILAAQRAPTTKPGSTYRYSNSNYLLLGEVVERAGGVGVAAALRREVTGPLGLRETTYEDRPGLARRMARGYERVDGALLDHWAGARGVPTDLIGPAWTDGGVVTTARDAARFSDALYRAGRVLAPATVAAMVRSTRQSGDDTYGMGTYTYDEAGRTWQGHDGDYGGYESQAFTDRAGGLTIAVLVNADGDTAAPIFSALARRLRSG